MLANKSARLTEKQQEILGVIQKFTEKTGESPTITELAGLIGATSLRTITQRLEALEKKRLITWIRHKRRSIQLLATDAYSSLVVLPVVSAVSCGELTVFAEPNYNEHVKVDRHFLHGAHVKSVVAIRAVGDSMEDAGVKDGDLVVAERTKDVHPDDKVIAIIDDMAVLKQLSYTPNAVVLNPMSSNPRYHPIVMRSDFEIFGKMIDVIKHQKNHEITYEPIIED